MDRKAKISAIQATKRQCSLNIANIATTETLHATIQSQLAPTEDDMDFTVPTITIHSLRVITKLRCADPNLRFDSSELSAKAIELVINAIRSKSTTPEEQALGYFTRKKLKLLSTWNEWKAAETKQLDQMHALRMFGKPIP